MSVDDADVKRIVARRAAASGGDTSKQRRIRPAKRGGPAFRSLG